MEHMAMFTWGCCWIYSSFSLSWSYDSDTSNITIWRTKKKYLVDPLQWSSFLSWVCPQWSQSNKESCEEKSINGWKIDFYLGGGRIKPSRLLKVFSPAIFLYQTFHVHKLRVRKVRVSLAPPILVDVHFCLIWLSLGWLILMIRLGHQQCKKSSILLLGQTQKLFIVFTLDLHKWSASKEFFS